MTSSESHLHARILLRLCLFLALEEHTDGHHHGKDDQIEQNSDAVGIEGGKHHEQRTQNCQHGHHKALEGGQIIHAAGDSHHQAVAGTSAGHADEGEDSHTADLTGDAAAGIKVIHLAGMKVVGIGKETSLHEADQLLPETSQLVCGRVKQFFVE